MIKINDMVQLFQLAREILPLRFLTRRDKLSDTNLLFNLFIFSFAFKLHRVERPQPPRYNCFSDFDFTPNWNWLIFDVFFFSSLRSGNEEETAREVSNSIPHVSSHPCLPSANSFQFISFFFVRLTFWSFIIHCLSEWNHRVLQCIWILTIFDSPLCVSLVVSPCLHSSLSFAASCYAV